MSTLPRNDNHFFAQMRNSYHDYADVDLDLVWDIAASKLPELKEKMSKVIKEQI